MRWCAARIIGDFGCAADLADQVIEGTPGREFTGRLSLTITSPPTKTHAAATYTTQLVTS